MDRFQEMQVFILLAHPFQLDGRLDLLSDLQGLNDDVDFAAPAECAVQQLIVKHDSLARQPRVVNGRVDRQTCAWMQVQMSQPSAARGPVQLSGSMGACVRKSCLYSAS
jgi:hypothetical protein